MDLTPVFIMATIFGGVIGIIWVANRSKLAQLKAKSFSGENNLEVMREVDQVKQENKDLRRRIEILEAIVVDADMKLMTGLDSELERRNMTEGSRENKDTDITL